MQFDIAVDLVRSEKDCLYREEWTERGIIRRTIHLDKATGKLFQGEYVNKTVFDKPWNPHLEDLISSDWQVHHPGEDPAYRNHKGRWKLRQPVYYPSEEIFHRVRKNYAGKKRNQCK